MNVSYEKVTYEIQIRKKINYSLLRLMKFNIQKKYHKKSLESTLDVISLTFNPSYII